jgi:hypothetical protein
MLRLATHQGDRASAAFHVEKILRWSGLPPEATLAAGTLVESANGDGRRRFIGRLARIVAAPGGAVQFFAALYENDEWREALAPE